MKNSGQPSNADGRSRDRLLMRLLISLVALFLIVSGGASLVSESYFGRTSKLGGAVNHLSGSPAAALGVATLFFGLSMLAVWGRRRSHVLTWSLLCLAVAGAALITALRLLRHT